MRPTPLDHSGGTGTGCWKSFVTVPGLVTGAALEPGAPGSLMGTVGVGEGDSWSDSLMDWSFYMLGAGLAMGLAAVAFHFAKHC